MNLQKWNEFLWDILIPFTQLQLRTFDHLSDHQNLLISTEYQLSKLEKL